MRRGIGTVVIIVLAMGARAVAQLCPQESATGPSVQSKSRTLEGNLIFHDGIRKWFELKLDQEECGKTSIELVPAPSGDWTPLETLRGCRVRTMGEIDIPGTGYYSLDLFQQVRRIEPVGACTRQLPFPDYSNLKPDKSVRSYRVEMHVNYRPGDHPIAFRISSAGKNLQPWQSYARYTLTGGFVLYGYCADGFAADKVFGTPSANPRKIDTATFDPESAAASGEKDLDLGFTCVRQ